MNINLSPVINFFSHPFLKESNCVYGTVTFVRFSPSVSISTHISLHVHITTVLWLMCILLLEQDVEGCVVALLLFIEDVERNSLPVGMALYP